MSSTQASAGEGGTSPEQQMEGQRRHGFVHAVAVVVFGALFPTLLLGIACIGMVGMQTDFTPTPGEYLNTLEKVQRIVSESKDANAYPLASFIFAEHSNQSVVTHKQRLKIAIMQIGFAVISVGVMFILLGIREGGVEGGGKYLGFGFDIRTGSTGLATFLVGAVMAASAGLLKNEYKTVGVPTYSGVPQGSDVIPLYQGIFDDCKQLAGNEIAECFFKSLKQLSETEDQEKKP